MKDRSIRTFTRLAALTVALLLLVSCAAAEAVDTKTADPYIELSTQYPAMTVKAGDSLTFALSLDNYSGASQDLTLSVEEIPEGWEGSFSASSAEITAVSSMRLLVVLTCPPNSSFWCSPYSRIAPQPPIF